jgi:hypothetical protein
MFKRLVYVSAVIFWILIAIDVGEALAHSDISRRLTLAFDEARRFREER